MNFDWFNAVRWDLPALMLALLLIGWAYSLWRMRADLVGVYRDENGKASSARVLSVGTWVAATWYLMQDMMDGIPTPEVLWAYVLAFSASAVLSKFAEKWDGHFPFTKGKE